MAMKPVNILVADDESSITEGLSALLELAGYHAVTVNDGAKVMETMERTSFAVILVDLMMPGLTGLEILREVKRRGWPTEVIIITGQGSIDSAVEAMKEGAYDYLTKPVEPNRIRSLISKAVERHDLEVANRQLVSKNQELVKTVERLSGYGELVGRAEKMRQVYDLIDAVADTTANVLITGESGTGKELVARAIHNQSSRRGGPFVAVNCSAFPRDILENELFGHEKGAFTGALKEKAGCFELADGGTLFLDEIGEMPADTQSKLLRVLEERSFRRLGGTQELRVDVRIVAATNQNIQAAMQDGTLREDLYFRLSVMEIELPALRQRMSDLPLLLQTFVDYFNKHNDKNVKGFAPEALAALQSYGWPGNVRELRNLVERTVILCRSDVIDVSLLPKQVLLPSAGPQAKVVETVRPLQEIEKEVIYRTLEITNNNKTRAAQLLGISLKTLHNKLNKYLLE